MSFQVGQGSGNAFMSRSDSSPMRGPSGKFGNEIPKGYKSGQLQQFTPEQIKIFRQLMQNIDPGSFLGRLAGGDQSQFEEMEAPALRQFAGLQGNLASRFSGMGTMGSRNSSGFRNAAGQQASDFAQNLQAQRQALQRQAMMDLSGMGESLLGQRPYEQFLAPKQQKQSGWGSFASGLGSAIPGAVTGFLTGGPVGAAAGAGVGFANGAFGR